MLVLRSQISFILSIQLFYSISTREINTRIYFIKRPRTLFHCLNKFTNQHLEGNRVYHMYLNKNINFV
uniref:Uncharacterized protein n=1 Tax=Arundo donax TaxID=35708 RepID=A0A0A9HAA1_ARUDO